MTEILVRITKILLLISSVLTSREIRWNKYDPDQFSYQNEQNITYEDDRYDVMQGIDVSEHQGEIDWEEVADAGYDFVIVRAGYRGYGEEGRLMEDTMAVEYLQDAKEAGLQVGAYFFSQALDEKEAREEARFAIGTVISSGVKLDLPLFYDPETIPGEEGRADDLSSEQAVRNAAAFCDTVETAISCDAGIYANLEWEVTRYNAALMSAYDIWYAGYEPVPKSPYHFEWWQYSERSEVPGIDGAMDLNLWIREKEEQE